MAGRLIDMGKKVSVVINTYNRGNHLKRLIDSLSKQTYNDFEVIIVNGPSTDNTDDVIEKYKEVIRVEKCPIVNLCVSRNIGIRASSGDIVAFIDDDAVPASKYWIEDFVSYYTDETVGGVGGKVFKINNEIEFANGYIDIWGHPYPNQQMESQYNDAKGEFFNIIPGGNASFSRKVLEQVGGFDEYYEYYHDESDLAVRVIKAGYKIIQHPQCAIYHEAAKSYIRKTQYHLNWYVITKNQVYFAIKASEGYPYTEDERKKNCLDISNKRLSDFKWMLTEKHISKEDYNEFMDMWDRGVKKGLEDGFNANRVLDFNMKRDINKFKVFDKSFFNNTLNIVMLCESDIIKPLGGVPTYTNSLAKEFIKQGHNVHVISLGDKEALNLIEGINIHTVKNDMLLDFDELKNNPNCKRIVNFSYECNKKIEQLNSIFHVDIVESPIWDCHGVVTAYKKMIPVCTRLQTPLKMVVNTFEYAENGDFQLLEDFESELIKNSDGVIYISDCIKKTIEELYEIKMPEMSVKNYLGIDFENMATRSRNEKDSNIVVFFIGRLERRKGIFNLLEAIPRIMEKYSNVEFRIAGDDSIVDDIISCTFKEHFLSKNKKAKWLDKVNFLGKISMEQREQEFANCDIFTSPSLYESFGIIFIEAMRYGRPVIGCSAGGMQEVISDGISGLLSVPNDTTSLIEKLSLLIENDILRNEMGKQARQRIESEFNNSNLSADTIGFYKKVIKEFNMKRKA